MQPHHQLPRIPHNRHTTANYPSELPPLRSYSIFASSKPFTLSSRPFLISNTLSNGISNHSITREVPHLDNNQVTNTLFTPLLQPQEVVPSRPQSKCQFCNDSFDAEEIMAHAADCDMQKISCEKCGERVPMQIYDLHFEECSTLTNQTEAIELRSPIYRRRRIISMEDDDEVDDDDDEDEGSIEEGIDRRNMSVFQQENAMSYEQLLLLDETIEKKGLTEEEMKYFKVQLHVKSLDGEGSCSICLNDYETAEYTRELSCTHKFHKQCIDKWLEAHITCPMCKKYFR